MFYRLRFTPALVLVVVCHMTTAVLHGLTEAELSELFHEYEVIDPAQVDSLGKFLSYNLKRQVGRKKRSLNNEQVDTLFHDESNWINLQDDIYNETLLQGSRSYYNFKHESSWEPPAHGYSVEEEEEEPFYFNINAFGSNYHLQLHKKERLIARNAQVIWYYSEGQKEKVLDSDCVHTGHIKNDPRSKVALTSCNGLAGLIKTGDGGEFFIEPIESRNDDNPDNGPQRHVVYRRSAVRSMLRRREESQKLGKTQTFEREEIHNSTTVTSAVHGHLSQDMESFLSLKEKFQEEDADDDERSRNKRHAKKNDYSMEILLTADDEVIQFHGSEHVENYLITLLNIVDEIYHDDSIGAHINIVLVRLALLDQGRSANLIVYNNPSTSLKNVCTWAHDMQNSNPLPSGKAHDHAIFLTRRKFGPAGYAHVTGMCHPLRSCTLNHEDGFSSAFVVAHETGHVLGMEHDGEGNKCGDETSMGSIMAPLVQAAFHRYHWSRCSQQELNTHIRKFDCLLDDPETPDWGPTPLYPGILYSMDDQCRFDFGPGYKQCTAFRNLDVCRILWCSHDDNPMFCKTKNGPPVDGTECGHNMWCFKSHCVWRNQQKVEVDGNWSVWSSYAACSRSCGTGVMSRNRECNNPTPSSGGRICQGKASAIALCNKRPCPGMRDYRAEQCRYHKKKVVYANRRHTWLPYESEHDDVKCELFCVSKETNDVVSMGTPVADGTRCSYDDPHSICINAMCQKVGCDKVIGSKRKEDECGVCGGDGSQCRRINGTYRKVVRRPYNSYMKMFSIPVNARKIRIQESSEPDPVHILAMKNRRTSRYSLNQRNKLVEDDVRMHFIDAGTRWSYVSENHRETITAAGPIAAEITIMLISRIRDKKANIHYSYVLHSRNVKDDVYQYELKKWYPCSVTCGRGTRLSRFGCRNKSTGRWVRKTYCSGSPPARLRKPCSIECKIPSSWHIGTWSNCSKKCGGGVLRRQVVCHQMNVNKPVVIVSDDICESDQTKPAENIACHQRPCAAGWRTGSWSACSGSCGNGIRRRQVVCRASSRSSSNAVCESSKPNTEETCIPNNCSEKSCEKESLFCKLEVMTKYCSIPGYRQMCCKSCQTQSIGEGGARDVQGALRQDLTSAISNLENSNSETEDRSDQSPVFKPTIREVHILRLQNILMANGTGENETSTPPTSPNNRSITERSRRRRSVHVRVIGDNSEPVSRHRSKIRPRYKMRFIN